MSKLKATPLVLASSLSLLLSASGTKFLYSILEEAGEVRARNDPKVEVTRQREDLGLLPADLSAPLALEELSARAERRAQLLTRLGWRLVDLQRAAARRVASPFGADLRRRLVVMRRVAHAMRQSYQRRQRRHSTR